MSWTTKITQRISRVLRMALFASLGSTVTVSEAALLSLSDSPLYLITAVEPNVLLTFDDSGSMNWAFLPDDIHFTDNLEPTRRGCATNINRVYYDPTTTYDPPVRADGTPLNATATSFTAAYVDGFNTGSGTVNLSTSYRASWDPTGWWGAQFARCGFANNNARPAYYYSYNSGCGNPNSDACYTLVQHNNPTAWSAAEQQNFANWYSYYRTRNLMAKTAAGRAFSLFGRNVRVSGQHLNNGTAGTGAGIRFTTTVGTMTRFCDDPSNSDPLCTNGSTARTDFFTRLYNSPANGGTPLRSAMQRAGDHFGSGNTGANSPYRDVPGNSATPERSCRQNFHVLFTDGYWNGGAGLTGNLDNTVPPSGATGFAPPRSPYSDNWSDTLADNAFYYWSRDLRTGGIMDNNNVPTRYTVGDASTDYWNPVNDPANWQHMVTFTIGLGIDGTLPFTTTTYNNLVAGAQAWPDPISNTQGERIDDLWHAALNSRGQYFSAANPTALVSAFTAIINDIGDRTSAASAAALNSGTLSSNTYVYQARFGTDNWTGQLLAYYINPADATIANTPSWDAGTILNDANIATNLYNARTVISYKPSTGAGIPFRLSSLDTAQATELNKNPVTLAQDAPNRAQERLDYLRGDATHENGNPSPPSPFYNFRSRNRMCGATLCSAATKPNTGVLGDIVNSAPVYVGKPPFNYPASLEVQPYSNFQSGSAGTRTPMLYVGANDGMLHGFDANTGREKLAYVPSEVYGNLSRLTGSPYAHRYFVDGSPVVSDVFINGAWRTILVGGLRKGGQGIFALDVTDPGSFSESNANAISLWEFNDNHDADLGYTFGDPTIAKMNNGQWAVIVAGGYNNDEVDGNVGDGSAALYILFIEDGMDGTWDNVIKIDTGVGSGTVANGLASPAAVDVNGDYRVDYIYAGDLRGNMWRFDVTSATATSWNNAANRKVIYVARDSAGNLQPITSRPQVSEHPAGYSGSIVYFGTGKYLETSDASIVGATTQTFYAVWDDYTSSNTAGLTNPTRSNLLEQTVTNTVTSGGAQYRATSNNNMIWRSGPPYPSPSYIGWYMDLPDTGERAVTQPLLLDSRILFTTVIPSDDPCNNGGDGWLMELNAYNGGRLATSPFDVNGDGSFTSADFIAGGSGTNVAAGGKKFSGIPSAPSVLLGGSPAATPACTGPKCKEQKLISTTDGAIQGQENNPQECSYCRASWRQVR